MSILGGSGGSGGIRVLMTAGLIPSLSSGVGAGVLSSAQVVEIGSKG